MPTAGVRKFAISVDPDEVVDFVQSIAYFEDLFASLGFEKAGTYRFRYKDEESTLTLTLESATDGYEVWATVQAADEHEYRIREIAEALDGHVLANASTGSYTNTGTGTIRRDGTAVW